MEWRKIPAGQIGHIKTLHDSVNVDDVPDGVGSCLVNDGVAVSLLELRRQKCKSALGMPDNMIPDAAGVGFCGYADSPQFVAADIYGIKKVAGAAQHGVERLVDGYKMALNSKGLKQAQKEGALW